MYRIVGAALLILVFVATSADADVVISKGRGGKQQLHGIKTEIGGVKINANNIETFLDQSTGVIWRNDFDGVEIRKSDKAKSGTTITQDKVVLIRFSSEPEALVDGYDQMAVGAWAPAIQAFAEVYKDKEQREVYRLEAYFQIGMCYVGAGSLKSALSHFGKFDERFPNSKSIYRPEAYRLQAAILSNAKRFDQGRQFYRKIETLPGISEEWRLKGQLGAVRVDIAERKHDQAIRNARSVVSATSNKEGLNDIRALAETLRAKAMLAAGDAEKFGEAQNVLAGAARLEEVSDSTSAELYATLGDSIYAQGRPEEARFAYMRVVTMYPGQKEHVAHALQNAGQCFIDMHGRALNAGENDKSDEYLIKGMKLLYECAGRHRGTGPAQLAGSTYKAKKKELEAAEARAGEGAPAAPPAEEKGAKEKGD